MITDLSVTHNGKTAYHLNPFLVELQQLDEADVCQLITLHQKKLEVYDLLKAVDKQDRKAVHQLVDLIEYYEFALQATWKFDLDRRFHDWTAVPGCKCAPTVKPNEGIPNARAYHPVCSIHFDLID